MKKPYAAPVKRHYVDREKFLQLLINYNVLAKAAKEETRPKPQIPNDLGIIFLNMSTRLATKSQFRGYQFVEDMVCDGYEECCKRMHNFDPAKSKNPVAYFTTIIWRTFLRRIKAEKKLLKFKIEMTEQANILGFTSENQAGDTTNYGIEIQQSTETLEYMR